MCINCNIPLPVAMEIIQKYNLPDGCIMTNRELAKICNPRLPGDSIAILMLMSTDVPNDFFYPGLDYINYTTLQNYEWILEKIIDTKWGEVRCGRIIEKEENNDDICENTPGEILNEIYKKWYRNVV